MRTRRGSGRTGRSAGRDNGSVQTGLGDDINLDGGVTAGVVDGAGEDLGDSHVGWWYDEGLIRWSDLSVGGSCVRYDEKDDLWSDKNEEERGRLD